MTGHSAGPPFTATAYRLNAVPRVSLLQISPSAAVTLLIGADPKNPAKKRVTNTEAAFVLTPVPMENNARQKTAGSMLILLPKISERGTQMIGPKTKPRLVLLLALLLDLCLHLQIQGHVQYGNIATHASILRDGVIGRRGDA